VILRIVLLMLSLTRRVPAASRAMPKGLSKRAIASCVSISGRTSLAAMVVTTPAGVTLRSVLSSASAT